MIEFLTHTPIAIREQAPWEKMKGCILVYEDEDGSSVITVSEMDWKARSWLSYELQNLNAAMSARQYEEFLDGE